MRANRDVYCYFDNDVKVKAPFDARRLIEKLGLEDGLEPLVWHGEVPFERLRASLPQGRRLS